MGLGPSRSERLEQINDRIFWDNFYRKACEEREKKFDQKKKYHDFLEKTITDAIKMETPTVLEIHEHLEIRFHHDYIDRDLTGRNYRGHTYMCDDVGRLFVEAHYSKLKGFEFKRVFFPQHFSVILSGEKASGCCYATKEFDEVIRGLLPLMQEKCLDLISKWTEKFGVK